MSDTIIMYENGKAVGGEGHPTSADEITFNNEDTDLVSEKVESAIKEVNAKFDKGSVSVTANGSKTYATLLTELADLVDVSKISHNSILTRNNEVYHAEIISPGIGYYFKHTNANASAMNVTYHKLISSATGNPSQSFSIAISQTGTAINDIGINVPTAGDVFTIHY